MVAVKMQAAMKRILSLLTGDYGVKATLFIHLLFATIIFVFNIVAIVYGSTRSIDLSSEQYDDPRLGRPRRSELAPIYRDACATVQSFDTWLHLLINILSTALLGTSNYSMQILSALNRKQVEEFHSQQKSTDIGVLSIGNIIKKGKIIVFVSLVLGLTSLPIHLLYNSAIVQSQGINGALTNIVTEDFFFRINTPDNVTNARWIGFKDTPYRNFVPAEELKYQTAGVWNFGRNTSYSYVADSLEMLRSRVNGTKTAPDGSYYESLGQTECREELLSASSISTFSSSFLVANQSAFTNNASVIFYEMTYPAERYEVLQNETLRDLRIRQYLGLNQTDPVFDKFKREIRADFSWEVEYCLINKTPNICRLEVSVPILIVTSICGLLKILCIGFTLYYLRGSGYKDIFLTIGDAISSFLTSHDRHTRDSAQKFISYSAFDKRRRAHWPLMKESSTYDSDDRSDRARFYASPNHWIFSIAVSVITGLIGAIVFFNEFQPLGARSELFSWRDYAAEGYPQTGYNKFYLQVLQINTPQLIISLIYIPINAILTIVCMNEEFIRYGRRPGPLRLTEPKGKQKGTYFLSLPFRYAIPLQVIFTLLHWLFSQGLFYKRISFYDWFGRTNNSPSISGIFARAGPIQIFFILFLAMVLFLFFLSWTKYPGGAPIVGTSTAAISAACWGPEGSAIAESDTICYRVLTKAAAGGSDDEEETSAEPWTPWVPVEGRAAEKCGFTDDTSCPEIESGGQYM